jgi:hypothetical protein
MGITPGTLVCDSLSGPGGMSWLRALVIFAAEFHSSRQDWREHLFILFANSRWLSPPTTGIAAGPYTTDWNNPSRTQKEAGFGSFTTEASCEAGYQAGRFTAAWAKKVAALRTASESSAQPEWDRP